MSSDLPVVWIVHRSGAARRVLARLAGPRVEAVLGAPGDALFDAAPTPALVLLGLDGDFEVELEFAHRQAPRHRSAPWILATEPGLAEDARRLFDTLPAEVLLFPPRAAELRRSVRRALTRHVGDPLSARERRDRLAERFGRWLGELEIPDLLRALDPEMASVPLLVRGEPGTGRSLLARYVHVFGGPGSGEMVRVPCAGIRNLGALRRLLTPEDGAHPSGTSVLHEEADRLPATLQHEIAAWIEGGPPSGLAIGPAVRWMATAEEDEAVAELEPALEDALAGVAIRLPPLRERRNELELLIETCAEAWCERHGRRHRRFGAEALALLLDHTWPGNLRELEAVVARSLAAGRDEPVGVESLRFSSLETTGVAGWPEVRAIGSESDDSMGGDDDDAATPEDLPPGLIGFEPDGGSGEVLPGSTEPTAPSQKPEPEPLPPSALSARDLRRLVGAIAHEVRNPLVAVRTFASLLPERFEDPDFRRRAGDIVGADVRRIESVVDKLTRLAEFDTPARDRVDVSALIEAILDEHRERIQHRRLVVLQELERERPTVIGDARQLRFALDCLLGKALELVPEHGDLFFASRHHPGRGDGDGPTVRILIRSRDTTGGRPEALAAGMSLFDVALEMAIALQIVRAHGGQMSQSSAEGRESVIVIDLPAPPD